MAEAQLLNAAYQVAFANARRQCGPSPHQHQHHVSRSVTSIPDRFWVMKTQTSLALASPRRLPLLLLALAAPWLPQLPANAAEVCSSSQSTVAESRCLAEALQAADRRLEAALARVAAEAASVPGDTFKPLWRENLTGFYRTSADPKQQAEAFRAERRQVCAYAKSVSFQGTGYGIFTTRCELALTRTLLDQLKP